MSSAGAGESSKFPKIKSVPGLTCLRSFFGQVPPIVLAILLVIVYLPGSPAPSSDDTNNTTSQKSKLARIDFKGSILFALVVLTLLLPIEIGGVKLPWTHPGILGLFVLSAVLLFIFIAVEKRQEEPILPLEIFQNRDAVFSFAILAMQSAAQLGVSPRVTEGQGSGGN